MEFRKQIFLVMTIADSMLTILAVSKYSTDGYQQAKQKSPIILMHKQQLSQDGAFNFAFAGDDGTKRGETIQPDGTRTGAYSYVDPNGETISVKYSADKNGFKILEGDHIPRASVPTPALYGGPSLNRHAQPPMPGFASSDENEDYAFGPTGSYSHNRAKVNPHYKAVYKVYEDASAEHYHQAVPYSKALRYESDEESRGPHSFGRGYSFEFGAGQS